MIGLPRSWGQNPFDIITKESARDLAFAARFHRLRKLVAEIALRRRSAPDESLDLIGMLVQARDKTTGEPMGERELVDEVMTLIIAGHETAASGLNSVWYLLSQHAQCRSEAASGNRRATAAVGHGPQAQRNARLYAAGRQ